MATYLIQGFYRVGGQPTLWLGDVESPSLDTMRREVEESIALLASFSRSPVRKAKKVRASVSGAEMLQGLAKAQTLLGMAFPSLQARKAAPAYDRKRSAF